MKVRPLHPWQPFGSDVYCTEGVRPGIRPLDLQQPLHIEKALRNHVLK